MALRFASQQEAPGCHKETMHTMTLRTLLTSEWKLNPRDFLAEKCERVSASEMENENSL